MKILRLFVYMAGLERQLTVIFTNLDEVVLGLLRSSLGLSVSGLCRGRRLLGRIPVTRRIRLLLGITAALLRRGSLRGIPTLLRHLGSLGSLGSLGHITTADGRIPTGGRRIAAGLGRITARSRTLLLRTRGADVSNVCEVIADEVNTGVDLAVVSGGLLHRNGTCDADDGVRVLLQIFQEAACLLAVLIVPEGAIQPDGIFA